MLASSIPVKFPLSFGASAAPADIRQVPTTSQIGVQAGAASLTDGFPPLCFIPVSAGGVAPFGADFNGILNQITAWVQWSANAGGPVTYDAAFSAAIGGYPKGAMLTAAAGGAWWVSTADNNVTNPDAAGAGWVQVAPTQSYTGNPNGNVAGVAGGAGQAPSTVWDTTNNVQWACTTSGNAATAVWVQIAAAKVQAFWCGTTTGSANAQAVTPPAAMQTFPTGTTLTFVVGFTNTGATDLTVGTFGTLALRRDTTTGPVALTGGELVAGNLQQAIYDGTVAHLLASPIGNLGTASVAAQSSLTNVVAAVSGAITAGHVAKFLDTAGTVHDGGLVATLPGSTTANHVAIFNDNAGGLADSGVVLGTAASKAASSNTGTLAAVSGGITTGHIATFSDTSGTLQDGGLPLTSPLLRTMTASGSASLIDTTSLTNAHSWYVFVIDLIPVTNNDQLSIFFSTNGGSTWINGGSAYAVSGRVYGGTPGSGPSDSNAYQNSILLPATIQNDTRYGVRGRVEMFAPADTVFQSLKFDLESVPSGFMSGSAYCATSGIVNAIKFAFAGGNIASGTIKVFGF